MNKMILNNKGIVLIVSYFIMVVLLGLSAVSFLRTMNEVKLAKRNTDSLEAFYEAEAGLAYAYAEASGTLGFGWYTHETKNDPVGSSYCTTNQFGSEVCFSDTSADGFVQMPDARINSTTGLYEVEGRNFTVKSFPDPLMNRVLVVLSQATINGVTRSIELRMGQAPVYQYFFFYPGDQTFGSAIYDGRNAGGIHVNGNISLTGYPQFRYLTQLTAGWDSTIDGQDKGYILRALHAQFPNLQGTLGYSTTPYSPQNLPYYMYLNTTYHFNYGTTYFKSGELDNSTTAQFWCGLSGRDADWKYDKYAGSGSSSARYSISDKNLKDLAIYEMTGHTYSVALMDQNKRMKIKYENGGRSGWLNEEEAFRTAYQNNNQVDWNKFWGDWRKNHQNDYSAYHGSTLTGGSDWQRRFFWAGYNWSDGDHGGVPDGINREWWEDLEYASDRRSLYYDRAPAAVSNWYTGQDSGTYFLNTKEQPQAWSNWLANNNLNEAGENKTLVQDKSQGGKFLDPSGVGINESQYANEQNIIKERAKEGGLYIGADMDEKSIEIVRDCVVETQFYNSQQPARSNSQYGYYDDYRPSNVLVLDVHALKKKVEEDFPNFNGVVYADLKDYSWQTASYDENANGVMLVNGERLPDGGLSIATPDNIYIKGNYNLDPEGDGERNRQADSGQVITRVTETTHRSRIDGTAYTLSTSDLEWQPAEILSKRAVYTLSENFPEPTYYPMSYEPSYQYYDEYYRVPSQDAVSGHPDYATNWWAARPWQSYYWDGNIQDWFRYYNGGQSLPSQWTASWCNNNWQDGAVYPIDKNGDGQIDKYILGRDLKNSVKYHIYLTYRWRYDYDSIHGADGSLNQNTPSTVNPVREPHIYNAAIINSYGTSPTVLEMWYTDRIINGAFIQLPDKPLYRNTIPSTAWYYSTRAKHANNTFNYEPRFGRGSSEEEPRLGLAFGKILSWREIANNRFAD